ncbi:MAG: peptide deformylase [Thiotrichales bacterium]|nr:MAG: peptide deformylase [Thiotrichales bacterium]
MQLTVIHYPHKVLRAIAKPVTEVNTDIQKTLDDMLETMYEFKGIGLAANQVGIELRMFVMDTGEEQTEHMFFINPEIVETSGAAEQPEGCLSLPGITHKNVKRPEFATIKALDYHGKPFEISANDYTARCMLHEIDHLNGKIYIDRLSPLKKGMAEKEYFKNNKQ